MRYLGVTGEGNFDGENILHIDRGLKALAHEFDRPDDELLRIIAEGREKLFEKRGERERPLKKKKIKKSGTGLKISAFIDAYGKTGLVLYFDGAVKSAVFIISN